MNLTQRKIPFILLALLPLYAQAKTTLDTVENKQNIINTNNQKPTLAGTCDSGTTVTAYVNGAAIKPTLSCKNGKYSITPSVALEDGRYIFYVQDNKANSMSNNEIVIINTIAPSTPTIRITEDSNNDGEISKEHELKGKIGVHITVPANSYISDTLEITGIDGTKKNITITEAIVESGYDVEFTAPSSSDEFTVSAMISDLAGNHSAVAQDKARITAVKEAVPDYIATITAQGTIITGKTGTFDIVVRIAEFNSAVNFKGDVRFTIVKNANLKLIFDPKETSRQDATMDNANWEFRELSGIYLFTYKGNNRKFPAHSFSKIGLHGTFNSPPSAKGQFALDVTIPKGSGEIDLKNNKDSEVIEYNNIK